MRQLGKQQSRIIDQMKDLGLVIVYILDTRGAMSEAYELASYLGDDTYEDISIPMFESLWKRNLLKQIESWTPCLGVDIVKFQLKD